MVEPEPLAEPVPLVDLAYAGSPGSGTISSQRGILHFMSSLNASRPLAVAPNAPAANYEMEADLAPGSLLARSTIWN